MMKITTTYMFLALFSGCCSFSESTRFESKGMPFARAIENLTIGMTHEQANKFLPDPFSMRHYFSVARGESIYFSDSEMLLVMMSRGGDGDNRLEDWRVVGIKAYNEGFFSANFARTKPGYVIPKGKPRSVGRENMWQPDAKTLLRAEFESMMKNYPFAKGFSVYQRMDIQNFAHNPKNYPKVVQWMKRKDKSESAARALLKVNIPRLMEKGRVIR